MCPLSGFSSLHYYSSLTVCVSNCSLNSNMVGDEGAKALGDALTVNQTLQTLRYNNIYVVVASNH